MDKAHNVQNVLFDGNIMLLSVDGTAYKVEISKHSPFYGLKMKKLDREF